MGAGEELTHALLMCVHTREVWEGGAERGCSRSEPVTPPWLQIGS